MHTILIVIHLLIVIALVGVVLIQKSEGGGLGIGGGSGFMTARGAANTLTRTTGILAAAFFATSLALGILARYGSGPTDILDRIPTQQQNSSGGTLLDQLNGSTTDKAPKADGAASGSNAQVPNGASTGQAPATNEATPASPPAASGSTAPAGTEAPSGSNANAPATTAPTNEAPSTDAPADTGSGSQIPTGQ